MKKVREGYKMTELGEIPSDWEFKSLKDICYIKGRIGWQGLRKDEFISEGPYLITGINFDRGKIIWNECYHITNERYEQAPEIQLKVGDVLMTKDGTIGKLLYVDNLPDKASLNSHLFVMRPINDSFISKYFYYHLQSKKFKKYIDNNKTGSTMPAITQAAMEKYKLILPPLEEQERIASILSIVDERIDNVDALIEKNKELKKGLMQTLLTKGIGHTKFKKTEIGEIPEEWHWGKLSNYVELKHGYQFRKEDFTDCGVPIVKISQISMRGKLELKDLTYISSNRENDFKDIIIKNGDILLALSGATVGKVALVKDLNGIYLQNYRVGKLICNDSLVNEYVFHYINSEIFYEQLMKLTNTSAQPNFGKQDMDKILITVPSKKEQQKIASILSKVDEKIDMYENKKQKLEELKKGLMQQLLTGKIRVI